VTHVIALSPVVDWRAQGKAESFPVLKHFTAQAFGQGYRVAGNGWRRIVRGTLPSPLSRATELEGHKLFLVHAKDDVVVPWRSVRTFARASGADLLLLQKGGHFSLSAAMTPRLWRRVRKFLGSRHHASSKRRSGR
jgi:hypothetical protein